ncbi:MAG TPA: sulfotransferase [Rhodospirillales bacterium]|nr:sulfotransferase [Rhodospirillales bacterium]
MDHQQTLNRLAGVFDRRMFFIVGLTRPGTAWLQHAIDGHPQACCRGEGHFTDSLLPLMGRAFVDYNRAMQDIRSSMSAAQITDSQLGRTAGFSNADVSFMMATAIALSLAKQGGDGATRAIGEKTPEHALAIDDLAAVLPEAVFVHVIRDGRDEAVSVYDYNLTAGNEAFMRKNPGIGDFVQTFGRNWARAVGSARSFGRSHPDRYLEIRSEDLLSEPATDLGRLCRFLDLNDGDDVIAHCADAGRRAQITDGGIGQWRDRFDDSAQTAFMRSAGELLKLLDYET